MTSSPASRAPRKTTSGTKRASSGKASSGAVIKAKYPGRCHCQKPYATGEKIAKNAQGWGHVECRETAGE